MSVREILGHDLFNTARVSHNKSRLLRKLYEESACCGNKVIMLYCFADERVQFTHLEKQIERVGLNTSTFQEGVYKVAQADDLLGGALKQLSCLRQCRVCFSWKSLLCSQALFEATFHQLDIAFDARQWCLEFVAGNA